MYMQVGMQLYVLQGQSITRQRKKRATVYTCRLAISYLLEGSRPWTVPCVASQQTDLQTEQKHP